MVGTFSYVVSEKSDSSTDNGNETIKEQGKLTIAHENGTYSISTIAVDTNSGSTSNSQYFFKNNGTTFTLADGESLTIKDLPTGTFYTVTEQRNDAYSTTVEAKSINGGSNNPTTDPPYTAQGTIAKHEDIHTVTYTNTRSPFTIGKEVNTKSTTVGHTLTYKITVENISDEVLTDIIVTDALKAGSKGTVTFSGSSNVTVNDDRSVTIKSLGIKEKVTITATYTTVTEDVGTVTNTATGTVTEDDTTITVTTPRSPRQSPNPTRP